jgi:murein DD-endopeptidase MepM/ murein hydrolase activator NlpD
MTVVGFVFLFFIGIKLATDSRGATSAQMVDGRSPVSTSAGEVVSPATSASSASPELTGRLSSPVTDELIVYPYDKFTLTQGPHGYSYGHMAIELSAGLDAPILSPIEGIVKASYIDPYGNPTLILENSRYEVTLLHGQYSVETGDPVKLSQRIGTESNLGYTTDWQGRSCRDRDCGYHTHLNVFDKLRGQNVNPMEILELQNP